MQLNTVRTRLFRVLLALVLNTSCLNGVLNAATPDRARGSGLLLVANKGDHTLGIIDPVAGRQIATVAEDGVTGHEVAASSDGKLAFVPIYGSGGVGGAGTDGQLLRVIDLMSCDASRQVAVIDLNNWKVEKLIEAGPGVDGLAWAKTD